MKTEEYIQSLFPEEKNIPPEFSLEAPVNQNEYLVNGELRHWNGATREVLSPICMRGSSGIYPKIIGQYPLLTEKESLEALDAASAAYDSGRGIWPTMSVKDRIKHLENFTYNMSEKRREIVTLLMWEIGKSYMDSQKEFDRTVDYINDTIDALKDLDRVSSRFVIEQGIIGQIRRAPLGVVLCMGPFNYPLNETFTTLIPALIMGNTVVFKPPKLGVLFYSYLLEAFKNSFPKGVINTVHGEGQRIITPLMSSGKIDALAFIGTSRVADCLKKQHPKPHRLRCVLGLDAKNPAIILPDADLDITIKECLQGTLSFNGQRCTALKILFVHSRILDEFLHRFAKAINELKCGMPWENNVNITPLPEPNKPQYLSALVDDALRFGSQIVNDGGGTMNRTFFYPALLCPVNSKMRIYWEEQFGPVIPVVPYDDVKTPIRYTIESNYGGQTSIFGSNPDTIARLIDFLVNQVCRVNI